jgi:hypothetical protein
MVILSIIYLIYWLDNSFFKCKHIYNVIFWIQVSLLKLKNHFDLGVILKLPSLYWLMTTFGFPMVEGCDFDPLHIKFVI